MRLIQNLSVAAFLSLAIVSCKSGQTVTEPAKEAPAAETPSARNNSIAGIYKGQTGDAKNPGAQISLELTEDGMYNLKLKNSREAKGEITSNGKYTLDSGGSVIRLGNIATKEVPVSYKLGDDKLIAISQSASVNGGGEMVLVKTNNGITEKYWRLESLGDRPIKHEGANEREPHLVFHQKDNHLNGSTGCNTIMGTFKTGEDGSLKIAPVATTKMACEDMKLEQYFLKTLQGTESYVMKGEEQLFLKDGSGAVVATFTNVALY